MRSQNYFKSSQQGLSLVEVLVATVIIALSVIPLADALKGSLSASDIDSQETILHFSLKSKMEEVLAQPYSSLLAQASGPTVTSTYSDPAGQSDRRLVYVSAYDGDNEDADSDIFTGIDDGILWIQVELEGGIGKIQTLKHQE